MSTAPTASISRKRLLAFGLVAVGLVLTGFLIGYFRQPLPLHEHARILHQAILEEDGATILRYVHPVERELNNLTPETTAALVREMINARYDAWGWAPEGEVVSSSVNHFSGFAEQRGRIPGVGRVDRTAQVHLWEGDRPMITLTQRVTVMAVLEHIWGLRKQGLGMEAFNFKSGARASLDWLDRHEKRLKELGVGYYASLDYRYGEARFISLEDLRRMHEERFRDPEITKRDPHFHARFEMSPSQALAHKQKQAQGR